MAGRLLLQFSGLCAFVPNAAANPTAMRVVLVDASMPHSGGHDEAHVPYQVFQDSDWISGANLRRPDNTFRDHNNPQGTRFGFCDLTNQDLAIDVTGPALAVTDGTLGKPCP